MKAEANVTPARLKAERFRELLAIKAVSKQEYDDAQPRSSRPRRTWR